MTERLFSAWTDRNMSKGSYVCIISFQSWDAVPRKDYFEDPVSISSSFEKRNGMVIPSGEKLPLLGSFPGIHTNQTVAGTLVLPYCDLTGVSKAEL